MENFTPKIHKPQDGSCVLNFDGRGSRGQKLIDLSGKENHGAITGASWKNSPVNTPVLSFDGVDNKVTIPADDSLDCTTGMTICFWMKNRNWTTIRGLASKRISSSNNNSWNLFVGEVSNKIRFQVTTNGSTATPIYSDLLYSNDWMFVTAVYNGSYLYIYIDGVLASTPVAYSSGIFSGNADVLIGAVGSFATGFDGELDLIQMFNRGLSSSEISQRFNDTKNLFGV